VVKSIAFICDALARGFVKGITVNSVQAAILLSLKEKKRLTQPGCH
jgi:hypothetical protein